MGRKQTRRSVSISGQLHKIAAPFALQQGRSLSSITEDALRVAMARAVDPELDALFVKALSTARGAKP